MEYQLVIYPNDILTKQCEKVKLPLSKEDEDLLNQMYEFVKKSNNNAVGLAAPQFGVAKRMIVIRHKDEKGNVFNTKMVNPSIVIRDSSPYYVPGGEKCLSEPEQTVLVRRNKSVLLTGYDTIHKTNVWFSLTGFRAAIAQHEVDHLNGILLHDYQKEVIR